MRDSAPASTIGLAAAVTIAAWVYTIESARAMPSGMTMPGGWSMSMAWMSMGRQSAAAHAAMFLVMWAVMMVAMMLPSVMPAVLLHRGLLAARAKRGDRPAGSQLLLVAGYFAVWVAFGAVAYAAGVIVTSAAMRSIGISLLVPIATGIALAAAGVYQLTTWKQVCLRHCRSPLDFLTRHQIRSALDSLRLGLHHGAYCAACCWGLMVIQLVLGIMSVPLMGAVAVVILLEKQWRHGQALARAVGALAVAGGLLMVLQATIRP